MARRFAQFLLVLALDGVGMAAAGAATLIQLEPAAPRWRSVGREGAAPRTQLIPAAPAAPSAETGTPAGARSATAPPSQVIPVETAVLRRSLPTPDQAGEPVLPADAELAAAPIRTRYLIGPSLGGGLPSGYAGGWGDFFISGSAGTPGKTRDGVPDGSVNMGFGLGDPFRAVAAEVYWGISSIKNFNDNGSFGFAVSRILVDRPGLQVALGGGMVDAVSYGNEPGKNNVNGYGAVSVAIPLRPSDPYFRQVLQFSVGGGGNNFAAINNNFQSSESGYFVAAGMEVLPNLGLSFGVSSRSANANISFIPFPSLPIFVNAVVADVFNATPFGTIGILTVGWSDNLRRTSFADPLASR